ncbi:hypothetical protein BJ508DRAFT_322126 [Ascobolus immersus RN42]|uniref:HTH APSES-type domain-containing protein n=1 Tax=Ascobolus immersus RN42 TaxID=1160509 RepID=A0A3N4IJZ4_ASCIM|nr:hypothetical protein BJ508DRAFT_322126 [Ascobolus immersus RN42]
MASSQTSRGPPPPPQTHPHPHPPPALVRHNSSSMTTSSLLNFSAGSAPSISSTPAATPPPQTYNALTAPFIYTAVYSAVPVYEMTVNNVAVMRRRKDSWLNATQILKVAGIDKGKRTKVLEKEILAGEHEKVQGGYGKISYERGVAFCKQHKVYDLLAPLLHFDENSAPGGPDATPTKEQAMAARRKQMYSTGMGYGNASTGPLFPQISSTLTHALSAMNKPKPGTPSLSRQSSNNTVTAPSPRVENIPPSQYQPPTLSQERSFGQMSQIDSAYSSQIHQFQSQNASQEVQEPPRKRARSSEREGPGQQPPSQRQRQEPMLGQFQVNQQPQQHYMQQQPPQEFIPASQPQMQTMQTQMQQPQPQMQQLQQQPQQTQQEQQVFKEETVPTDPALMETLQPQPLQPLNLEDYGDVEQIQHALMNLFVEGADTQSILDTIPPHLIDLPIDSYKNAALHWAASLAKPLLLRALINKGANIFRVNAQGETALMRGCFVINNYNDSTFPALLDMLHPTIPMADNSGRTILHHIAIKSGMKNRSQDSRYYLESLLEFIVRNSTSNSSTNSIIPFTRFLALVVNARDSNGDTALNIAARIGNKPILSQLLDIGASPHLPNRAGLRPTDFGIGAPTPSTEAPVPPADLDPIPKPLAEKSQDIVDSIRDLIQTLDLDFHAELAAKQSQITQTLTSLREASAKCAEESRQLEQLRQDRATLGRLRRYAATLTLELEAEEKRCGILPGTPKVTAGLDAEALMATASAGLGAVSPPKPIPSPTLPLPLTPPAPIDPASLPSTKTLLALKRAYLANEVRLKEEITELKGKSTELEETYRKVVALCTDMDEAQVEGLLEGLVQAVESEGEGLEEGRVLGFLRKVEGGV